MRGHPLTVSVEIPRAVVLGAAASALGVLAAHPDDTDPWGTLQALHQITRATAVQVRSLCGALAPTGNVRPLRPLRPVALDVDELAIAEALLQRAADRMAQAWLMGAGAAIQPGTAGPLRRAA